MSYQILNATPEQIDPIQHEKIEVNNPILNPYPNHENHLYNVDYQRGDVFGYSIPRGNDQLNYSAGGNLYRNAPTYTAMPQVFMQNNTRENFELTPDSVSINGVVMKKQDVLESSKTTPVIDYVNSSSLNTPEDNKQPNILVILFLFLILVVCIDFWKKFIDRMITKKFFGRDELKMWQLVLLAIFFTCLFLFVIYMTGINLKILETLY